MTLEELQSDLEARLSSTSDAELRAKLEAGNPPEQGCSLLPCPFCGSQAKTLAAQKDAYRHTFAMTGCFNSECRVAPHAKCYYVPQKRRMGRAWAMRNTATAWNGRAI